MQKNGRKSPSAKRKPVFVDDDAIEYFLSKENVGMAKLIFKWEFLKNNRELSELQLALVSSSPVLVKEWLKLQTDDAAAAV